MFRSLQGREPTLPCNKPDPWPQGHKSKTNLLLICLTIPLFIPFLKVRLRSKVTSSNFYSQDRNGIKQTQNEQFTKGVREVGFLLLFFFLLWARRHVQFYKCFKTWFQMHQNCSVLNTTKDNLRIKLNQQHAPLTPAPPLCIPLHPPTPPSTSIFVILNFP